MVFLASCSKDPSMPQPQQYPSYVRKVLIEEFTGHVDGHNVIAADTIMRIQNRYPGKVIAVTVHSGFFSRPFPPPFITDLRCNEGEEYFKFLNISYNPVGVVNWIGYPNDMLKDYTGEWGSVTDSLISLAPEADISITNNYNSSTRMLNSSVRCKFLNSFNGTYKLTLLLTEDSIIAPQKDYSKPPPNIISNYAHRHVLRDGITASWGDVLNVGSIAQGDSVIMNYVYTLPPSFKGMVPDENHCRVVAYVYDASNYQVLQAEEKKIK